MKQLLIISFAIIMLNFFSCEEEKNTNNKEVVKIEHEETKNNETKEVALIDIPNKTNEETKRYILSEGILAVDVFNANIAMNEGQTILAKMFSNAKIAPADATETFDSFNIVANKDEFNAVITYEQNKNEEFVIHTVFISKGLFSFDILDKIFS